MMKQIIAIFTILTVLSFTSNYSYAGVTDINLVKNCEFENDVPGSVPHGYDLWKLNNKGSCGVDGGFGYKSKKSVKVSGVTGIAYQYSIDVKPGEKYILESLCTQKGKGIPTMCVYWKDSKHKWTWSAGRTKSLYQPFEDKWKKAVAKVQVPAKGVAQLTVLLSVEKQESDKDVVWFDNVSIKKEKPEEIKLPHYKTQTRIIPLTTPNVNLSKLNNSQREVRDTLRMGVLIYSDITKEEAEKQIKQLKDRGYNAILTEGQRYLFSESKKHPEFPGVLKGTLPYPDLVRHTKIVVDACHKYGLKTYLHLTASAVPGNFVQRHPDRMTLSLKDGKTKKIWTLNWACLNNDDFMKEYYHRLENLIKESGADGLMVDETSTMMDLCGCHFCRKKFKQATGYEIPETDTAWIGDNSSLLYRKFMEWRIQNCLDINKKIKKILQSYIPDGTILSYYALPYYEKCWAQHGFSIDALENFADTIGWEAHRPYSSAKYWPLFIANLKLIRAVSENKDGNIFVLVARPDYAGTYLLWLLGLSQGTHQYWSANVSREMKSARTPLILWEALNEKLLAGLHSFADTAVLISTRNNNLCKKPSGRINRQNSFFAICNTLTLEHIPYKALVDKDIQSSKLINKAKTIIMMNIGLISDAEAENIREFVKDGGTLIASAETSLYDENGKMRKNFALADLFGCNYKQTVKGKNTLMITKKSPVTGNFMGKISQPDGFCAVEATGSAEVLGYIQRAGATQVPGLVFNTFGKGKVVYFAGHPETSMYLAEFNCNDIIPRKNWQKTRDPEMVKLFCNTVKNLETAKISVGNLAPGIVFESYKHKYEGAEGIQVHLLNLTGMMPGWEKVTFPDIKKSLPDPTAPIKITLNAENVRNAFIFSPDFDGIFEVPIKKKDGVVTCELPSFARYMVIYFNQGKADSLQKLSGIPVSSGQPVIKTVEEKELPLEGKPDSQTPIVFMESSRVSGGRVYNWDNQYMRAVFNKKYSNKNDLGAVSIKINLKKIPEKPVIEVGGMDDKLDNRTAMLIKINGKTIFKGRNDFRADQFSKSKFEIPSGILVEGDNNVVFENTETWTDYWGQPYFGIYYVKITDNSKKL
jgi:hypothetical protein